MNENLKECPHCGKRPIIRIRESNKRLYRVECQDNCQSEEDNRQSVIDSWNKRN